MNTCIEFKGNIAPNGYGRLMVDNKAQGAHRLIYRITHGVDLKKSQFVCHSCDNRKCIRPSHLFVGTHLDNQKDCTNKGRRLNGSEHPNAKLTEKKVAKIIKLIKKNVPYPDIAKKYKVTAGTICNIKRGKTWKHVPR